MTITGLPGAQTPETYASLVRAWAQATWEAWSAHHGQLREWADTIVAQVPRLRGR